MQIAKAHLKTLFPKLILAPLILYFILHRLYITPVFFINQFAFYIIFALGGVIIVPLLVALEESLHMAVCIQQGKSNYIKGVVITYALIKDKHRIFIKKAAANFYGGFTPLERIQIHGAAPCLILFLMSIIFFLVVFLVHLPIQYLILLGIFMFISPILNLVPSKFDETDGYFIVEHARHLKLSALQTIGQVLYGMFLASRYVVLGTRGITKFNKKLASASEFFEKGNFKKALSLLEENFKKNQNNPEICNNIACCYAELGTNLERAITLAKKAIDLDADQALYHDTLGWCYYKNSNLDKAKECIIKAINIDPDNEIFQKHLTAIENAKKQSTS
jgi:hypothetical protein